MSPKWRACSQSQMLCYLQACFLTVYIFCHQIAPLVNVNLNTSSFCEKRTNHLFELVYKNFTSPAVLSYQGKRLLIRSNYSGIPISWILGVQKIPEYSNQTHLPFTSQTLHVTPDFSNQFSFRNIIGKIGFQVLWNHLDLINATCTLHFSRAWNGTSRIVCFRIL